jgi:Subtilase family
MGEMFRPILGKGENYIFHEDPRNSPPSEDKRPSLDQVRTNLNRQIRNVRNQMRSLSDELKLTEVIVNLKLSLGYSAKSYHPKALINRIGATEVGTKKWKGVVNTKKGEQQKDGKDIFIRINENNLDQFENLINTPETLLPKNIINEIRTVHELYLTKNDNLIDIFSDEWTSGRIEFVLHPFGDLEGELLKKFKELFEKYGGDVSTLKIRSYSPGPIFISAYANRDTLNKIIKFNPLRTCHPLEIRGLPSIRLNNTLGFNLPKPPLNNFKSPIKVGVFDGGVDLNSPLVSPFVTEHNPISTKKDREYVQHGLGVAGTILYGDLRNYDTNDQLDTPMVNVESFRVLPLENEMDFDLYDVIDLIEDVVPKRNDLKVYNLSIGPYGPIEDDYISRFTYVLDELSRNGDRLFVVAVGNDGELSDGNNRIQAPSDTVNGIGVGAYTLDKNQEKTRASYSCIGSGREGSKVKPDVLDFGGNTNVPFHLIGLDGENRFLACGTSFAAPLVSKKAAEIIGRCNMVDPLVAKALIINSASHPKGRPDKYYGYGFVPEEVDEILGCTKNKVTILYRNQILPKKFARLQIPIIKNIDYKGKVKIQWTITVATKPNATNTEDYTLVTLEDTFYPHNNKYKLLAPPGLDEKSKTIDIEKEKELLNRLLEQGWKISRFPVTNAPIKPKTEEERKADYKWDTVLRKESTLMYSSLQDPYLILHAMDRYIDDNSSDFFNYAVVITVEYLNYKGDAYQETLKQFNLLEQANVRARNEIIIRS